MTVTDLELKELELKAELAAVRLERARQEEANTSTASNEETAQPSKRREFNLEQTLKDVKSRTGIS